MGEVRKDGADEALAWRTLLSAGELSDEERRIVELLAKGHTQAETATRKFDICKRAYKLLEERWRKK